MQITIKPIKGAKLKPRQSGQSSHLIYTLFSSIFLCFKISPSILLASIQNVGQVLKIQSPEQIRNFVNQAVSTVLEAQMYKFIIKLAVEKFHRSVVC